MRAKVQQAARMHSLAIIRYRSLAIKPCFFFAIVAWLGWLKLVVAWLRLVRSGRGRTSRAQTVLLWVKTHWVFTVVRNGARDARPRPELHCGKSQMLSNPYYESASTWRACLSLCATLNQKS